MTRLRIPKRLNDHLPASDYEVLYVRPAAGELQIAPSKLSMGQKERPLWDALKQQPGVRIECSNCRNWYAVDEIPIDEVPGWRCPNCRATPAVST